MKRFITFFITAFTMALAAPVGAQWDNNPPSAYQPWQPPSPAGAQWSNGSSSTYPSWQPPSSTYERITRHSREFDDMQERSYRARQRENQWRRNLDATIDRWKQEAMVPGYIPEGANIRHPSIYQTGCHQYNLECLNRLQSR